MKAELRSSDRKKKIRLNPSFPDRGKDGLGRRSMNYYCLFWSEVLLADWCAALGWGLEREYLPHLLSGAGSHIKVIGSAGLQVNQLRPMIGSGLIFHGICRHRSEEHT